MKATDVLRHEHQIVLFVLDGADGLLNSSEGHLDIVGEMVDFFKTFADGCHHSKEEKLLFPALHEKGMSTTAGPIAVMLAEHDDGRRYLRRISEALPKAQSGDLEAAASIRKDLRLYSTLLRAHIAKENAVLFPMSDKLLSAEDQARLEKGFEKIETDEMGAGVHERYHEFAHRMQKMFTLAV